MGILANSADWVTTNYFSLITMSHLVASLMLLSVMVMVVNTLPECMTKRMSHPCTTKREALDDPVVHITKRDLGDLTTKEECEQTPDALCYWDPKWMMSGGCMCPEICSNVFCDNGATPYWDPKWEDCTCPGQTG